MTHAWQPNDIDSTKRWNKENNDSTWPRNSEQTQVKQKESAPRHSDESRILRHIWRQRFLLTSVVQSQLGHILCAGLQETCSSIASHTFGILYASEKERQTHAYTLSHNYIPTSSHIDTSNCKQGDGDGEIPKGAGSLTFCVCVGGGGERRRVEERQTHTY